MTKFKNDDEKQKEKDRTAIKFQGKVYHRSHTGQSLIWQEKHKSEGKVQIEDQRGKIYDWEYFTFGDADDYTRACQDIWYRFWKMYKQTPNMIFTLICVS